MTVGRRHGLWLLPILLLEVLKRAVGASVLVCFHRPIPTATSTGTARRLSADEVEHASQDHSLDLALSFVDQSAASSCFGVVNEGKLEAYAWSAHDADVPAVQGLTVRMPATAVYLYKAFTTPQARGRRLLGECVEAIAREGHRHGCQTVSTLVELQNRSSLRAFRRAGFDRRGLVLALRWPGRAVRVRCRCAVPCEWARAH